VITELTLENFKSFHSEVVPLRPLTLLVGANASGKSNLRDALRFLHAIGRKFSLAECLNGSYGENGQQVWQGIRGGAEEAVRRGKLKVGRQFYPRRPKTWPTRGFGLEVRLGEQKDPLTYRITVECEGNVRLLGERLQDSLLNRPTFDTHPGHGFPSMKPGPTIPVVFFSTKRGPDPTVRLSRARPVLTQLPEIDEAGAKLRRSLERARSGLASLRFLDPNPMAMRNYTRPEMAVLGDQGENLSGALYHVLSQQTKKQELLDWLTDLMPTEIEDLDFYRSETGEVLLKIVEPGGREVSARSASDGTLRYLSLAAALLTAEPHQTFFVEEIENGVHPTRVYLLMQMLEQMTAGGRVQVIATTHSPLTLAYLSDEAREGALYCYRDEDLALSHVVPIMEIPGITEALEADTLERLLTTGWMEHQTDGLQSPPGP